MNLIDAVQSASAEAKLERSERTARAYNLAMRKFVDFCNASEYDATTHLSSLPVDRFVRFPAWLLEQKYTKKTVGVYVAGVKYLLEWLVVNTDVNPDYSQTLKINKAFEMAMKRRETRFPRFPKNGEAERVRDAVYHTKHESPIRERNIAVIEFLYGSGCRNNELRGLTVGKIDLEERLAFVIGKGNKERVVLITSKIVDTLRHYWQVRGFRSSDDVAFARHDGHFMVNEAITTTTVRNIVEECVLLAGMDKGKFTPHHFRHAFAIRNLRDTGNLAQVQDLMGHASADSTREYAKIYPDNLRELFDEVNER